MELYPNKYIMYDKLTPQEFIKPKRILQENSISLKT